MDSIDISFIEENYEFISQVEKITDTEIVPLSYTNLSDYAKFIKKHDDEFDSKTQYF